MWGNGLNGQLGNSARSSVYSPIQLGSSSWAAVGAGPSFSMAIRTDGALFTWGYNFDGYLGINLGGTGSDRSSPVQVGTSSWTSVAGFTTHTLAIRIDGALFAWGYNYYGELGDQTIFSRSSPVQIGTSSWSFVKSCPSSNASSGAIRLDGALFMWGQNNYGQLGDGTTITKSSPVQIGSSSWSMVSLGNSCTSGLGSNGNIFTWGVNQAGQLANNESTSWVLAPTQIKTNCSKLMVGTSGVFVITGG